MPSVNQGWSPLLYGITRVTKYDKESRGARQVKDHDCPPRTVDTVLYGRLNPRPI